MWLKLILVDTGWMLWYDADCISTIKKQTIRKTTVHVHNLHSDQKSKTTKTPQFMKPNFGPE